MFLKVTILGSGTSTGVPEYKCNCDTCQDARKPGSKNRRTRPSIHIEKSGRNLQVDTGPDFIQQIDSNKIEWIDAVVYTHCHSDHIAGTNDLVMPCRKQEMDMPIYGPKETMEILERNFDYMCNRETFQGGGVGHLVTHTVSKSLTLCGFDITPVPVEHGIVQTFGYRIDDFGYVPDVKKLPAASRKLLHNLQVLVIDALSFNPRHPTHLSVGEAVEIVNELQPCEAYFTHIMHRLDHNRFQDQCTDEGIHLPPNIDIAFDGQIIVL